MKSNGLFGSLVRRAVGLQQVLSIYDQVENRQDVASFVGELLSLLDIKTRVREKDWERITSSGPTVVVSNHPFGALEGLLLAKVLLQVRKDTRFLANPILKQVPELSDLFFFVDPYQTENAFKANFRGTKDALRWLQNGGLLATFPSGEVSHIEWNRWTSRDPLWNPSLVRMILRTNATVVPVFICGHNSAFFHAAGLIHPRLRTILLPRELINKRGREIEVRIGKPIPASRLPQELHEQEIMEYLRFRTFLLQRRTETPERKKEPLRKKFFPPTIHRIAPHEGTQPLIVEVESLPEEQTLVTTSDYVVKYAHAWQAPHLLHEIGRLREKTFRRVGEGTGKALDLDEFDSYYLHLFAWSLERKEIVGAYRIGRTDEIVKTYGVSGLYTNRLFRYGPEFMNSVSPGLELGRSFIRPKYQKMLTSLSLLWKGIGTFLVRHPHYRYLFGPVSVSNDYSGISRSLLVEFMRKNNFDSVLAGAVQAKRPPEKGSDEVPSMVASFLNGLEDLSDVIADVESKFDGVPILVRHYLRLGGKFIAFNVDVEFFNSLDGLIMVDLLKANEKMVQNYMGKSEYQTYIGYHKAVVVQPPPDSLPN